jgi:dienelactone hydrolase
MSATEVIRLWPDGPPTVLPDGGGEIEYPASHGIAAGKSFFRNISDATLTVFTPAVPNGAGVIVAPGGGWTINAWGHEGLDVADWLTAKGYTVFLLKYRVRRSERDNDKFETAWAKLDQGLMGRIPAAKLPRAMGKLISTDSYLAARAAAADDGRRAIAVVRAEAERFGVDPATLGMLGFSAGAFLTIDVAMDPRAAQLAWLAAIYGGETCGTPVPEDAPPLFSVVAQDDVLWKICEGLHIDWSNADRSSEQHVFARGSHGFGMIPQGAPSDVWPSLFLAWLKDQK